MLISSLLSYSPTKEEFSKQYSMSIQNKSIRNSIQPGYWTSPRRKSIQNSIQTRSSFSYNDVAAKVMHVLEMTSLSICFLQDILEVKFVPSCIKNRTLWSILHDGHVPVKEQKLVLSEQIFGEDANKLSIHFIHSQMK